MTRSEHRSQILSKIKELGSNGDDYSRKMAQTVISLEKRITDRGLIEVMRDLEKMALNI